jgi:hypothetical protein
MIPQNIAPTTVLAAPDSMHTLYGATTQHTHTHTQQLDQNLIASFRKTSQFQQAALEQEKT